jgi:mono/diheme cytochrome c family protein
LSRGPRQDFIVGAVLLALAGWVCPAQAADSTPGQAARGRYLAEAGDCVACHTVAGAAPYSGGRALVTPFGVIYTPNLTPDGATGLGLWSADDFYRALHNGVSRNGSRLYPAFPFPYFTRLSRSDADDLKAFFDTLKPVNNRRPPNELPWPLSARTSMRGWNLLFFRAGGSTQREGKSAQWNRGAYLVDALGHCGACHTAKNSLGADKNAERLQGGEILDWLAPNLSGDLRSGLGAWSADDIVEYLHSGRNARALAGGPMREVIENSTSKLDDADLRAIAVYLKDLPAGGLDGAGERIDAAVMAAGEAIFVDACSACHARSGAGLPRAFAPLKGSAVVQSQDPLNVVRVLLTGARVAATDARPTPFTMPSFAWKLSDAELAAVATYVRNSWGNAAPAVSAAQVKTLRNRLARSD